MMNEEQDQQSRVFSELSSLIHGILKYPSSCTTSSSGSVVVTPNNRQVSAAGFASLLLGVSLSLMLCGSVTFVIGFILMPWVLGIVLVFYLVGVVSALSSFGRAFLYPPPPSTKQIPEWNFW
ncbi:hypothetical protein MKW94_021766 [Papaver nudicaule]|uniref:Transmembrane protein n=1 Tax=Papaver nudicaule TaxID=74823 RepID=A0AA41S342_PAPNU|nr:hypothetical protein [Papaver nudicaule]